MPVYEYKCTNCNEVSEFFQKICDPLITECPYCSKKLDKIVSINTFLLKGSGWYSTDYASNKNISIDKKDDNNEKV